MFGTWHDCQVDSFLVDLGRSWPSVALPGVRPYPVKLTTYWSFDWGGLPPMPAWVTDDYGWLASSPVHEDSTLALASDGAQYDIGEWDSWSGRVDGLLVPEEFVRFARDPSLRRHLRSATYCVFDPCRPQRPGAGRSADSLPIGLAVGAALAIVRG